MYYRTTLALLVLIVSAPTARSEDAKAAEESKRLQGEWQAIKAQAKGEKLTKDDAEVKNMRFVIEGDKMTLRHADGSGGKRTKTFKLDPTKTPKELDITSHDGSENGETAACIYKLENDRLTICMPRFQRPHRPSQGIQGRRRRWPARSCP